MVIRKESLDQPAQRMVGDEVLVREHRIGFGRCALASKPLLDLAPLVCGEASAKGKEVWAVMTRYDRCSGPRGRRPACADKQGQLGE